MPAFYYISKNLKNKKKIIEIHNVLSHETNFLEKLSFNYFLKNFDKIIVHTKSSLKYIKSNNVSVIPFGFYEYERYDKNLAREKLNIDENAFVILFFGNIRKYKGLDVLLNAFEKFSKNKNTILIVAGRLFENLDKYKKFLNNEKIKFFLRFIEEDEIPLFFEASDVLVLPYKKFDSQSGVIMLAINYEKPYIISSVEGLMEFELDKTLTFKDENELIKILEDIYNNGISSEIYEKLKALKLKFSWENYINALKFHLC